MRTGMHPFAVLELVLKQFTAIRVSGLGFGTGGMAKRLGRKGPADLSRIRLDTVGKLFEPN
jgi:hypothetical protein